MVKRSLNRDIVNPDGMPVALEGLETLRSYLMSAEPATAKSKAISDLLARQITTNRTWTRSPREQTDFADWAPATKTNLADLRQLSTREKSK
jgi:hypothetical protein